jgi:N-acetylneuraminate synthase
VAVAAVALGAEVVEKHLTLSRDDGGPDAAFSMEPDEFAQMSIACRQAYAAIGTVHYGPTESEKPSMALRRSLWWAEDLRAGTVIERKHIKIARPWGELAPARLDDVIGMVLGDDINVGTPVLEP